MDSRKRSRLSLAVVAVAIACLFVAAPGFFAQPLVPWPYAILCAVGFFLLIWAATKISPALGLRKQAQLQDESKTIVVPRPNSQDGA